VPDKLLVAVDEVIERLQFNMLDTSFFVGRLIAVPASRSPLFRIRNRVFEAMHRNALAANEYFRIPPGRVVELGGQIEI
jgi:KUP system potassium uptake protein